MREFVANRLEALCGATHDTLTRIPVPDSWFEKEKYAGWRGNVCHFLYGHALAQFADRVLQTEKDEARVTGTPWSWHARRPDYDDPYCDGMDWWGDPVDWSQREEWADIANAFVPGFPAKPIDYIVFTWPASVL